jgi:CBS domain-containing protein
MMSDPVAKVLEEKGERVETVTAQTPIGEAIARMNARRIGSVVVMDGERLVGIFTERDVLTRVVPQHIDPRHTAVAEVMSRQPTTISPTWTVQEAMVVITESRHRHLPVLQAGRLVGMVSIGDLTRWIVRDQQRTIDDLTDYVCRA